MKPEKILYAMNDIDTEFLNEARMQPASARRHGRKFAALIAAVIALMALTVTAFAADDIAGWFKQYFTKHSGGPLTPEQIQYIEEHEQLAGELLEKESSYQEISGTDAGHTQTQNGWSVELKSAITDGKTGYILFSVTAPEDIDLEASLGRSILDGDFITPGNNSLNNHIKRRRTLCRPSNDQASEELNYIWNRHSYWEADNDGRANTLDYMIEIQCKKLYPERECLLKDPFGSDITFNVRFIDFTYEYKDPEIQKALDEKYAGQDNYIVDGDETKGLRKSDILVEGVWEFDINFAADASESIELISEPVMVEAQVWRKIENGTMFYDTTDSVEQVKLTSFRLTSFGAQLMFAEEEDMIGVFIEYQNAYGYEDRYIYVVMNDGSNIALKTNGIGTELKAESPIVLAEVDHVLLADGTKLMVP